MENIGKWITSIPMEVTIMRRSYTKQEKFDYVMECRSSGLLDYQWCRKNNISPSTFYNWTQQLKNQAVVFLNQLIRILIVHQQNKTLFH